ncbi:hypothetical protein QH494_23955 [Sphingomonas sp. AR_OL41]|uniref:hypothetical protein n=1 Tax=Sphingomonas sp. AR_OL41 TaxID=3042729 RepID=UPI0024819701|nr:hypothetical protein [Sphingomonas sp. AR_OL41]MDH7975251.1 hypothetical protein [Sphingomonas sp. AR_OL41]
MSASKRPSARLLTDLARAQTEVAIGVLAAMMTDAGTTATARIAAANALLDRGWGRPRGEVEAEPAIDIAAIVAQRRRQVIEGMKDEEA